MSRQNCKIIALKCNLCKLLQKVRRIFVYVLGEISVFIGIERDETPRCPKGVGDFFGFSEQLEKRNDSQW
jgi:hypothetical protein